MKVSYRRRGLAVAAIATAGLMVLAGCTPLEEGDGATSDDGIKFSTGVTAEACPDAVNADNGCIYLGVLSDLTEGPFAALAVPLTDGQRAFWKQVNEKGGIGGFDVDIDKNTRDTKYQAAEHAAAYQDIEANILAIAQTLGTVNTQGVLADMEKNSIVAAPASWWSGYNFAESDEGIILQNGYSYCTEAMLGLDWLSSAHSMPKSVAAVGYPGDYGGDSAAGVQRWADANGATVTAIPTGPNQVTGNQDAVVAAVMAAQPEAVVLAIGPAETAEIVGKLAGSGFKGRFLGSLPTWNPALLGSAAAPALVGLYNHMSPFDMWDGDSQGIADIKASLGGELPNNHGYVIGWASSYPILSVLEAAAAKGDLTREGVRAAIDGLTVSYAGMIKDMTYSLTGSDSPSTEVTISAPDASVDLGLKTVMSFYSGTTFKAADYTSACSAIS